VQPQHCVGSAVSECNSSTGKKGNLSGSPKNVGMGNHRAGRHFERSLEWPLRWLGGTCRVAHDGSRANRSDEEIASRHMLGVPRLGSHITRFRSASRGLSLEPSHSCRESSREIDGKDRA